MRCLRVRHNFYILLLITGYADQFVVRREKSGLKPGGYPAREIEPHALCRNYLVGESEKGPFLAVQLKELADLGRISADAKIRIENEGDSTTLERVIGR